MSKKPHASKARPKPHKPTVHVTPRSKTMEPETEHDDETTQEPSPVKQDAGHSEQDKDKGPGVPGVGPADPAQHSPGPVETIEELGIGPRDPYPSGEAS